ncbi:MAG: peptide chain release factor 2 [Puniceicoccales bacterium]|jgi:peptide chain release factor 2|nr:peptide chain release factor 2 [Puniceicoccales bacterium]
MILESSEILSQIGSIGERITALQKFLDIGGVKLEIERLEEKMNAHGFWDSQKSAQKIIGELNFLRKKIDGVAKIEEQFANLKIAAEILEADRGNGEYVRETAAMIADIGGMLDRVELASYLGGKYDSCNAFLAIQAGAGGTESCDWADMLLRMYTRWAERNALRCEIQDMQPGEEAGLGSVTIHIEGEYAYGHLKSERGVHRLVRISPFDANRRRHTSFCSVDVIAEIEDDEDVKIDEADLRIDTYRSSGKGGQHVNKTESAIRVTHIPSGIVVTCQNERSQYKNKDFAMRTLRSRLFERMEDEKRSEMEKFYGPKGEIGWGYQIRSYVLQPYQMIKDLRTGEETSNVQAVLDGDIDNFIHAWLKAGCPRERKCPSED